MTISLTVVGPAKSDSFSIVTLDLNGLDENQRSKLYAKLQNDTSTNIDTNYIVNDTSSRITKLAVRNSITPYVLANICNVEITKVNVNGFEYEPPHTQTFEDTLRIAVEKKPKYPRPKM